MSEKNFEIFDNDSTAENTYDKLPELSEQQIAYLDSIKDPVSRANILINILNIPIIEKEETNTDFDTENNIYQLYYSIIEKCQYLNLFNKLSSHHLLVLLHPEYNPPF